MLCTTCGTSDRGFNHEGYHDRFTPRNEGGIDLVICHYCRAQNSADEHRCTRCGRRLSDEPVRFPVQMGAVAPEIKPSEAPTPEVQPARPGPRLVSVPPPPSATGPREAVQASLFGPMPVSQPQPRVSGRATQTARRKSDPVVQQRFEFGEGSRTLKTSVEASVYCNATVAPAAYRVTAAAIDVLIPLVGFAVFFTSAQYMTGEIALDKKALPVIGAAAVLIALFYRVVCCLGNMDTPGMQWAGLRLLDFDGRLPTRRARLYRFLGGVISFVSAGMGLFWSLADEERLTWHDHMSRTFPTARR